MSALMAADEKLPRGVLVAVGLDSLTFFRGTLKDAGCFSAVAAALQSCSRPPKKSGSSWSLAGQSPATVDVDVVLLLRTRM